jgi:DNA-binding MarR family transcriptional regulator
MEQSERYDQIGDLAVAILRTVPLLYRRVIRKDEMLQGISCCYPKTGILVTLMRRGPLPLSTIAKLHSYSRQNLTTLTDRLEADGLVRRVPDAKDRRVINLELTDAGRKHIHERGERLKQELVKELECMDDAEIQALRNSFETIARLYLRVAEPEKDDRIRT